MDELKNFPDNIIDSVVTDPPYGLSNLSSERIYETIKEWSSGNNSFIPSGKGFMNKDWDSFVPPPAIWSEIFRVLKPGGHILCFAGSRTLDLMSLSIRLAGFEIRDTVMWLYGSGFPKSHNLSGEFEGFGTALKPAVEPIVLARKPLDGTVLQNMQKWGVGALNIERSRIEYASEEDKKLGQSERASSSKGMSFYSESDSDEFSRSNRSEITGRWPANLVLDEESASMLDEQSGFGRSKAHYRGEDLDTSGYGTWQLVKRTKGGVRGHTDSGGASRFFYVAKTSTKEREAGLESLENKYIAKGNQAQAELKRGNTDFSREVDTAGQNKIFARKNHHPTVKPIALMSYLCKMVTPPGGTILDPFTGSGTTGIAATCDGFNFIGIEQNPDYSEIAKKRIEHYLTNK